MDTVVLVGAELLRSLQRCILLTGNVLCTGNALCAGNIICTGEH